MRNSVLLLTRNPLNGKQLCFKVPQAPERFTARPINRLAALTGAPVLPVFIVRQPAKRKHRIEIQDEIAMPRTDDEAADIEENTRRLTKAIEDMVRCFPEQFLWTHRRYRTRPIRGAPSVYGA